MPRIAKNKVLWVAEQRGDGSSAYPLPPSLASPTQKEKKRRTTQAATHSLHELRKRRPHPVRAPAAPATMHAQGQACTHKPHAQPQATCTHRHACTHIHMCTHTCTCKHVRLNVQTQAHQRTHTHTHTHARKHAYTSTCICAHAHTNTHTYTHANAGLSPHRDQYKNGIFISGRGPGFRGVTFIISAIGALV